MRRAVPLALALALVVAACSGGADEATPSDATPTFETLGGASGATGEPLPVRALPVLGSDTTLSTADLVGTPAVINFWATWCPFCVEEMPDLERAHQALDGQVRFIGVDREDPQEASALALAAETGVSYDLVRDADGSFFRDMRARGMPTTILVAADGTIRHRFSGPLTADQLLDLVEEHLGVTPRA